MNRNDLGEIMTVKILNVDGIKQKLLGADNIVIGHTIQDSINTKCDNK